MVGTQAIKSKGAYNERVHGEPNSTLENSHKREKDSVRADTPIEVNIAFVTIGNIDRKSVV